MYVQLNSCSMSLYEDSIEEKIYGDVSTLIEVGGGTDCFKPSSCN